MMEWGAHREVEKVKKPTRAQERANLAARCAGQSAVLATMIDAIKVVWPQSTLIAELETVRATLDAAFHELTRTK